jgi:RNA polymerase sigma factor (sigma-70 family)
VPQPTDFYTTHAAIIESALAQASRSHRLAPDAADEFCSWARVRLLDHDQAILRKFQERSSLRTFLVTVVQRLYLDWRNAEWGKWRPTAEARRQGPVAIELERLVLRDQLSYDEAVHTIVARGTATRDECERAWVQLPRRPRRKRVDEQAVVALASTSSASDIVDDDESRAAATAMCEALARALAMLPPADRLILQLRYWSRHTVARIAVLTGADQKALYRRFDKLTADLRRSLEAEGLSGHALAAVTGRFSDTNDGESAEPVEVAAGNPPARPSTLTSTGGEHA